MVMMMRRIDPKVYALKISGNRKDSWKFKSRMMRRDLRKNNNIAEYIWWVNTKTRIQTLVHDHLFFCSGAGGDCNNNDNNDSPYDDASEHPSSLPPPPGISVFAPLIPESERISVIDEVQCLFESERVSPSLMGFHMTRDEGVYILFYPKNSQENCPSANDVIKTLSGLTPNTSLLLELFCESITFLLKISRKTFDENSTIGIIKYDSGAGLHTHIDNVTRLGGSVGPVFTMSLGGGRLKYLDMFPVIEHWKDPVRIAVPEGAVILMDGISRLEWSHGVPSCDPTERYTIIVQLKQISTVKQSYSKIFKTSIFCSEV